MVPEWSEKWIAQGQTPEAAYRALMVAYAATGNRSQVAATYERCRKDLGKELAVEPSDETRSLYEQIMRGETVARVDLHSQPIPPVRLAHPKRPRRASRRSKGWNTLTRVTPISFLDEKR
jgi:DNA-binding SARP family transcriptional activator